MKRLRNLIAVVLAVGALVAPAAASNLLLGAGSAPTITTTAGVAGPYVNNAASFTSANSEYLSKADNASFPTGDVALTYAGWFYLTDKANEQVLMGQWDFSTNDAAMILAYNVGPDRIATAVRNQANTVTTAASATNFGSPPTGTWVYAVAWHDPTADTINIQINDGTANSTSTNGGIHSSAAAFIIGCQISASTPVQGLNGRSRSVAMWGRVLTGLEKTWLYNSGKARSYASTGQGGTDCSDCRTNLISWWDLGETSGTRADRLGTNNLTDNNTVTVAAGPTNSEDNAP
jgi:hypothetical protein